MINYNSDHDWDKNWIKTKVIVKGGAFGGEYVGDFTTTDFELFKRDIKRLDKDFKGAAKFEPIESQLVLEIKGDGIGHFELKCIASDNLNYGGTLTFSLTFDQTELNRLFNELDKITKAFPIVGDMQIMDE